MKLSTFVAALLLLSLQSLSAQQQVRGRVVNEAGRPAEFTTMVLMQAADSTVVKLELADESGAFRFSGIPSGDYRVKATGVGYADYFGPVFAVAKDDVFLEPITLTGATQQLETVEVVARKPLLEQRAGKLVVNVENSITGQTGSVIDLLRKVPGLIVVGDRISMAGRAGVTILIDGRPTRYMDVQSLLREMPADNIAKIEVISQPGAAFDAEGTGGVINIVLKKNSLYGTSGSVYVGGGYGELWKGRAGSNLNYRNGRLNVTSGLNWTHRSWVEGLDLTRTLPDRTYVQFDDRRSEPNSYSGNLGADFDLTDDHRIGFNSRLTYSDNDRLAVNTTDILTPEGALQSAFVTRNDIGRWWRSTNLDAYYRWQIDTTGRELTVDGSLADFTRRSTTDLSTTGDLVLMRQNIEPADTKIRTARIDYKQPFGQQLEFSAGAKISAARLDNELRSLVLVNDEWTDDSGRSNRFRYREDIAAAYGNLRYQSDTWEANFGLRFEDTRTEGYSVTLDSTNTRDFRQLFPSLSISTPLAGPLGLSVAYSYRIERPSYYSLNPFVTFLDPLTFERGNPFLRPELTHSGQVSLTYDKQPFFNLQYDLTNDVMAEVTEQNDATGEAFQTEVNLDRYVRYGGSLFFPLDFIAKPISGYAGVMVFYNDYDADYLGGRLDQDRWNLTGFLQVNCKLPADWKLEVTGWYQGAGVEAIMSYRPLYGVNAGLQKNFLDDKLELQISGEGIIQQFWRGEVRYQNQNFDIVSTWEAPIVNFRINYKFGNQFLKKGENRRSSADEERQRAQF